MKRNLTEEQKARAVARREAFQAQCKRLAEMSEADRAKLLEDAGGVVTCEGRGLSARNIMLLCLQRPGVSVVGGFRQWQAAGRYVKKGEKALSILVPTGRGETVNATVEEAEGGRRVFFITGSVFNIDQTRELGAEPETALEGESIA